VHRPGCHTRAEILSELAWIEALRADDVLRTVTPLPRLDGELTVIDFDDCGVGWFCFDLAAAPSFIEEKEAYVPGPIAAWLVGYRDVATLSAEDEAIVPVLIVLRRVQLTAWQPSHRDADTACRIGRTHAAGTVRLAERFIRSGLMELLGRPCRTR